MPTPTPDDLTRLARIHVASLRAAGVRWIPKGQPLMVRRKTKAEHAADLFDTSSDAAPSVSAADRRRELRQLDEVIKPCPRCAELAATRTQTVFGVGPVDPDVCF